MIFPDFPYPLDEWILFAYFQNRLQIHSSTPQISSAKSKLLSSLTYMAGKAGFLASNFAPYELLSSQDDPFEIEFVPKSSNDYPLHLD